MEAFLKGVSNLGDWTVVGIILAGVGLGTFVAVAPQGLGVTLVFALLLPVVVQWQPMWGIALFVSMVAVSGTGDIFLPTLFGIPGGGSSQAVVLDAYPLGKKGMARRVFGIAFSSSFVGTLVGLISLLLCIPVARVVLRYMGSAELFVVVVWGVTMVAVLAGPNPLKGLVAACFGIMLSLVGFHSATGVFRFTTHYYFIDGISVPLVAVAIFGIPSALSIAVSKMGVETKSVPLTGKLFDGVKDTWNNIWLAIRTSVLGMVIGCVPGLGGSVIDWLAYGHAAQTCKGSSETFGTGDIRAVVACTAPNDARSGGILIPTLFLGVPGDTASALFLIALLAFGFVPGPSLVKEHLDVIYSIALILAMSSLLGQTLLFSFSNQISKIALIRYNIIVVLIISFVVLGALSANRHVFDLIAVVLVGLLSYFMRLWRYPRAALILGFILGRRVEKYFWISWSAYGFDFLLKPSVVIMLIIVAVMLGFSVWRKGRGKSKAQPSLMEARVGGFKFHPVMVLTLLFAIAFPVVIAVGWDWPLASKLIAFIVAIPGSLIALIQLYRDVRGVPDGPGLAMDESGVEGLSRRKEITRTIIFFSWFIGTVVATWLLGIVYALPLFAFLYTLVEGREKWWKAVLMGGGIYFLVWGLFQVLFMTTWPPGRLFY